MGADVFGIAVIAVLIAMASFLLTWKTDSIARRDLSKIGRFDKRLRDLEEDQKKLRATFMKVLRPIEQNAENIDQLDDDLYRLEARVDELKHELAGKKES